MATAVTPEGAWPRESTDGPANCAKQGAVAAHSASTLDSLHRCFIIEEKLNFESDVSAANCQGHATSHDRRRAPLRRHPKISGQRHLDAPKRARHSSRCNCALVDCR